MLNSIENSPSRRSPSPGLSINPFSLTQKHPQHVNNLNIVHLKSDRRIFCPSCFDETVVAEVGKVEENVFTAYVNNLFEALDQHGDRDQLREIVLPILDILLKHRKLRILRDDDYHELSRIIYKTMKIKNSDLDEFSSSVRIFSGISIELVKPVPLKSAWNVWKLFLDRGQIYLPTLITDRSFSASHTEFFISLITIVKNYLSLVNSHVESHISDLVFPIMIKDTKDISSRKYYKESQEECLKIMITLGLSCAYFVANPDKLNDMEVELLGKFFDALTESFKTAVRIGDKDFLDWLKRQDYINSIHSLLYKRSTIAFRQNIENFLKEYILNSLEEEYGKENVIRKYLLIDSKVVTSARLVRMIDTYDDKLRAFGFYVLLNCVAIKQNSNYFFLRRVNSVLRDDSEILTAVRNSFTSSMTIMRAFAFVTAVVTESPNGSNAAKRFIKHTWKEMLISNDRERFYKIFCHDEVVFNWAYKHPDFAKLMNSESIRYCISHSSANNFLSRCLSKLLSEYRSLIRKQIRSNYTVILCEVIKLSSDQIDEKLMNDLAALLSTMLHESVLRALNDKTDADCIDYVQQEMSAVSLLLRNFDEFIPYLDQRFITDLSRFMEEMYQTPLLHNQRRGILIVAHELMTCLIKTNHPCVNKLIHYLDFTLLGYMYSNLENRRTSKELTESIAEVLIAYDSLDYPFEHKLESSLYLMVDSAVDWTFSHSKNLHLLALKLLNKIFTDSSYHNERLNEDRKLCLATGFIHMLYYDSELVADNLHIILPILELEVFKYHPLMKRLLSKIPSLANRVTLFQDTGSPSSPDLSFESVDGDFQDDISISRILDQLSDDFPVREPDIKIPKNIYLSKALSEHSTQTPTSSSTQDWERRAYETSQSSYNNTQ